MIDIPLLCFFVGGGIVCFIVGYVFGKCLSLNEAKDEPIEPCEKFEDVRKRMG